MRPLVLLNPRLSVLFVFLSELTLKVILLINIQETFVKIVLFGFFNFYKCFTLKINHLFLKQNFVEELKLKWVF